MSSIRKSDKWDLVQRLITDPALSPTAKIVGARLLHHLNGESGQCNPSYQTLADGTGLTKRRVMSAVRELEAAAWITVTRRTHDEARRAESRSVPTASGLPCLLVLLAALALVLKTTLG